MAEMEIVEIEITEMEMAVRGREYWIHIKEKYVPDEETGLIIMQSEEQDMVDAALGLLPVYMKRKYLKRAIVVMERETAAGMERGRNPDSVIFVEAQREEIDALLAYHRVLQFFHEIAVISVEEPYGNANIIGKEGITLNDYVKNALYV